jgi:hypothetical protein
MFVVFFRQEVVSRKKIVILYIVKNGLTKHIETPFPLKSINLSMSLPTGLLDSYGPRGTGLVDESFPSAWDGVQAVSPFSSTLLTLTMEMSVSFSSILMFYGTEQ